MSIYIYFISSVISNPLSYNLFTIYVIFNLSTYFLLFYFLILRIILKFVIKKKTKNMKNYCTIHVIKNYDKNSKLKPKILVNSLETFNFPCPVHFITL